MKVTYLFGAGASRGAIPIVNDIPNALVEFERAVLKVTEHRFPYPEWKMDKDELIRQIKWLTEESGKHQSIDTFAKKLYLRRDNGSLLKLKLITSLFLTYLQRKNLVDKRYDAFFASILRNDVTELPRTINIISWNYDLQFELSYLEFNQNKTISEVQNILSIESKLLPRKNSSGAFSIIKLNGSSALLADNVPDFLVPDSNEEHLHYLIKIFGKYGNGKNPFTPTLSFAWENESKSNADDNIVNKAINESKDSEVLVIIGYSFPYFNREIDALILKGMPKLKRVYFQSNEPVIIRDRFSTLKEHIDRDDLVLWSDTGQFLLPKELGL